MVASWDGELYAAVFPPPELGGWDERVYTALACAMDGPVLELGAGTGRILCALLRAGVDAVGVEGDLSMARSGWRRLRSNGFADPEALLRHGQIASLQDLRRYRLVLLPDNTLSVFVDDDEAVAALAVARDHLRADGEFVLDQMLLPAAVSRLSWDDRELAIGSHSFCVRTWAERDAATGLFHLSARAVSAKGEVRSLDVPLRPRTPRETEALLARVGLEPRGPAVDERGGPISAKSRMYIGRFGVRA